MKENEVLEFIEKTLTAEYFTCDLHPETEEEVAQLLVNMTPEQGAETTLQITAIEQQGFTTAKKEKKKQNGYFIISFNLSLPFKATEDSILDVMELLNFINNVTELPGFLLDEDENISFQYTWFANTKGLDETIICGITGLIALSIHLFYTTIEQVANGSKSYADVLTEITKTITKELEIELIK